MKFVCYSSWDLVPDSAHLLFERAETESVFLSRPWFESLSSVAMDDELTLLLACVVAGDRVLAILPLMQGAGNIGYSLKHGYTPLYSLILAEDPQQAVLACLAQGLSQMAFTGLLLEPVGDTDPKLSGLQPALQREGFSCEHMFRDYNWIYRVQGQSYEEYMAARPAKLRNTIARKMRKLDREHGYDIRLFTGADVPGAMADYYVVYNASWKQNELTNTDFLNDFVAGFSRAGWTRLAILYIHGQPVAAQLWFVGHGTANIFRLSYDEAWKTYSPGSILTRYLMEYVIDVDKVAEIDFLTGNDKYKQDWMSERRERFVLSCTRGVRSVGMLKRMLESLTHILKRFNK